MPRVVIGLASSSRITKEEVIAHLSFYYKPEHYLVVLVPQENLEKRKPRSIWEHPLAQTFLSALEREAAMAELCIGVIGETFLLPSPKGQTTNEHTESAIILKNKANWEEFGSTTPLYPDITFRSRDVIAEFRKLVKNPREDEPEYKPEREESAVEALINVVRLSLDDHLPQEGSGKIH
jgi:hypothetical protein